MWGSLITKFFMTKSFPEIVVANGDGIGPEIMHATLEILRAAECGLTFKFIEIGAELYKKGWSSGIPNSAWNQIEKSKILLKSPITTPMGSGYKSLNVTLRRKLGLNVNLRPCKTYMPFIGNKKMDVVFIRENEEDLYCGVEFQRNHNTFECIKIITEDSSTKIAKYAFDYAVRQGRKKITCMVKDNIMKMTDGCFFRAFEKVAKYYPQIETDRYIIDIGSARIATKAEDFDVVLLPNLYGDIVSDIGAEVAGSVGIAGSANLGDEYAMFEAIHGSAPGMKPDTANPSALINASIMMLRHLKMSEKADLIENAWLCTIEQGIHTKDISSELTNKIVGTKEFSENVIQNLGYKPQNISSVENNIINNTEIESPEIPLITDKSKQVLVGFDLSINIEPESNSDLIAKKIDENLIKPLKVRAMSSKGMKIWPERPLKVNPYSYVKVRISHENVGQKVTYQEIFDSLKNIANAGVDICRFDSLYAFNDKPGFSAPQGD